MEGKPAQQHEDAPAAAAKASELCVSSPPPPSRRRRRLASLPATTTTTIATLLLLALTLAALHRAIDPVTTKALLLLLFPPAAGTTATSLVYVSSYAGTVTTLNLTIPAPGGGDSASLTSLASTADCGPNPSWLTLDRTRAALYGTDEGRGRPDGHLVAFRTGAGPRGGLATLDRVTTLGGPVSTVVYGAGGMGLAVAES